MAGSVLRVERLHGLVELTDPSQAVTAHERVIEQAQRQSWHEGVDPDGQPCQLNGDRIEIDTVDASTRDLPAQKSRAFDLNALPELSESVESSRPESLELCGDLR